MITENISILKRQELMVFENLSPDELPRDIWEHLLDRVEEIGVETGYHYVGDRQTMAKAYHRVIEIRVSYGEE